ncbi:MAG: 2-succinyl-5-enolpyruvyl-6-hydroxy-3-cyclohexene-carboxylic-acid synthase [Bacteroidota bacterium]|jgi:2-succinyl-5-enolpyruvyl-6-hydroxy-3-cyclohexene-1-carboxylate synthase
MITSSKWTVQLIIDQCVEHGVVHWVFSPGSRNAPLAIAAEHHPAIETVVIHDERSAAFFALGLAEQLGQPVALCCTSGSAPANYLPAITEAFYRSIPLLIVSADRPMAWTDQGDGQTIRQPGIFRDFTHRVLHLEDRKEESSTHWEYLRESALLLNQLAHGPVHINLGLSEPLYETETKERTYYRKIKSLENHSLDPQALISLVELMSHKKVMVLCGQQPPIPGLQEAMETFALNDHVVVLTENTSNVISDRFNSCIDRSLNAIDASIETDFMPEILITLGGSVVSKRIKSFLRRTPLAAHLRLGLDFPEMDTYQQLTHSIKVPALEFFKKLNAAMEQTQGSSFFKRWKSLDLEVQRKSERFETPQDELVDFEVYRTFFAMLPEHSVVHLGNSSVIRYAQLFSPIKGCTYLSNRGTSGIDGCISTAMGYASKDARLNVLLIGDVSYLYDVNALQIKNLSPNLKIILINNQGGGIFNIIDGSKDAPEREKYFEAKHSRNGSVAEAFGWKYRRIEQRALLVDSLRDLLFHCEIECLEIATNNELSPRTLNDFFTFVR